MINEKNKANRIMKELLGYFVEHGYYQFDLHFDLSETAFNLTIRVKEDDIPSHFEHLLRDLNTAREVEMDEYYNALLGGHSTDHDYTLLGKAIDEASLSDQDGYLILKVVRYINVR